MLLAPRPAIVAQVPPGASAGRCPDGSRIAFVDLAHPDVAPRVLSGGFTSAGAPAVSADGARIAFVGRRTGEEHLAVFTCAADGSAMVRSVEVAADCGSAAFLPDGRIVFSAATGSDASALFVTDAKDGPPQRITFSGGEDVDPWLLPDGRIVFASRARREDEFRPFSVHVDGTGITAWHGRSPVSNVNVESSDPAWRTVACVELAPRRRPQGHLSVVDAKKTAGDVFCVDARPAGVAARRIRFTSLAPGGAGLGDVPLEPDGSFFVRLPPDVPLALELLDAEGHAVARQHAPFWVRPGETRGCIGCHEDPDTAPPNVRPRACLNDPIPLGVVAPPGAR